MSSPQLQGWDSRKSVMHWMPAVGELRLCHKCDLTMLSRCILAEREGEKVLVIFAGLPVPKCRQDATYPRRVWRIQLHCCFDWIISRCSRMIEKDNESIWIEITLVEDRLICSRALQMRGQTSDHLQTSRWCKFRANIPVGGRNN